MNRKESELGGTSKARRHTITSLLIYSTIKSHISSTVASPRFLSSVQGLLSFSFAAAVLIWGIKPWFA